MLWREVPHREVGTPSNWGPAQEVQHVEEPVEEEDLQTEARGACELEVAFHKGQDIGQGLHMA